jgi:hypothetical protein
MRNERVPYAPLNGVLLPKLYPGEAVTLPPPKRAARLYRAYGRVVLWLIRPALEQSRVALSASGTAFTPEALNSLQAKLRAALTEGGEG